MITKIEKIDYKNINTNNKQQILKNNTYDKEKDNSQKFKDTLYTYINKKE